MKDLSFDSNLSLNQLKWKFLSLCLLLHNLLMQKPANVSKDIVLVYFLAELATSNLEAAAAAVVVHFHLSNESGFNLYLDATT